MTKINRITIHGFKSFAQKTEIPFDDKYNCILGPNGSGKSNVGDAICFVLGRLSAKSLRAEKTGNMVFNGGKNKRPASEALVEIAFSNESKIFPIDANEVVVSRALTKDGTSIYRLNGKKATRTEILDVLSSAKINPQGYNIVLQGDIHRFVDMTPLERRGVIEEISDVSTYEEKKHKAILELTKVDEKMNEASVILKERRTYLNELKKDRDQAIQFRDLKKKIDSYKATIVHLQFKEKEGHKGKYDREISKFQEQIIATDKIIESLKKQLLDHKSQIIKINSEIEEKGEKGQLKVHKEVEDLKVSLAEEKTRLSTLKDEINKLQLRKDQLVQEMKEIEEKSSFSELRKKELQQLVQKKSKDLQDLEKSIGDFKKKNKIESSQEMEKEIEDIEKIIETREEGIQKIRQSQQELLRDKDRLEYQLESLDEKIKKRKEVEQQSKAQVQELQQKKQDFKSATLKLNQCLDQDSSFAAQLANGRKRLVSIQDDQAKLNGRINSAQASLASNHAVSAILENRKKFKGVHGTVAELGQVNKKFALALETAAGSRMQFLIVDDDEVAADCIKFLKNQQLGTASFIPLNKIKTMEIGQEDKKLVKSSGAHDFAINLVSFKPQFQKAFSFVFGNTLVVEDIETARKIGIGKIKMASLDGSLAESSGVMRGGFNSKKSFIGFKEKDSLEELEKLDHEIGELQGVVANLEIKREANDKEISFLRNKKSELEAEIIKLEKTLHLEDGDLDATTEMKKELGIKIKESTDKLNNVMKEITNINKDLAELKTKKQNFRSQVNELRNPRLLAQLSAFDETKIKTREEISALESEMKNLSSNVEQMFLPEKEKIKEIMKQHEKEEIKFQKEIKDLAERVAKKEKDLSQKESESKEFYSKYKELFNQREKLSAQVTKAENEIESARDKIRNHEREINMVSLQNAEIKAKLAGLEEEFTRYKDAEIVTGKSVEELQHESTKQELVMAQMSTVNMKALEIYEEVEKEYGNLVEKRKSLEKEKTDVLTLMNEIETKKKEHFMNTFEQANDNFQKVFTSLFKKGKAYLELENPAMPFEGGLNVKVRITGNRFLDIKSLSGGEKTLTALSFIFAIQEYQPASFYVLDEIDAALDKHNSETLSKLIRSYSTNAQYIVISHNDSIISEADSLFGVTMNEDGISKIVALKI